MQPALKILGLGALALTVVPPMLFVAGAISLPAVQWIMTAGCLLWFATAPFFLNTDAE